MYAPSLGTSKTILLVSFLTKCPAELMYSITLATNSKPLVIHM